MILVMAFVGPFFGLAMGLCDHQWPFIYYLYCLNYQPPGFIFLPQVYTFPLVVLIQKSIEKCCLYFISLLEVKSLLFLHFRILY